LARVELVAAATSGSFVSAAILALFVTLDVTVAPSSTVENSMPTPRLHDRGLTLTMALLGALVLAACASRKPAPPAPPAAPAPAEHRVAGVVIPPPLPPRPVVDNFYGTAVTDPYLYAENTADPVVAQWMRAQADATAAVLARIPGRDALLARLREIDAAAAGSVSAVQRTAGGRLFFSRREPGENQFKLVWRTGATGRDTVLVDPEALGQAAGKPLALVDWKPSPDGRRVAYALQVAGSEIGEVHVIDVDSGRALAKPMDRIRFASVNWLDDGSGFFFARLREGYESLPATERFGDRTTHFFSVKSAQARPVFSASRNADLGLPTYAGASIAQVPGTRVAMALVSLGVERNRMLYLADLTAATEGRATWRKVVDVTDQARVITVNRDWIYVMTSAQAPRHRVLRTPLRAPAMAKAEVVVPAGEAVIVNIAAARDALYVTSRTGAALQLTRRPHASPRRAEAVALPFEGTVSLLDVDARLPGAVVSVVGWTRAAQRFLLQPAGGKPAAQLTPLTLVAAGSLDAPPGLTVREVEVASHDGVKVPVSIIARSDVKLDGSNPTVLFGYGAYGITENPFFNPRLLAWLEQGGVYVYAHVRGGGIRGTEWHLAGKQATKPNTWRDGIAVAEWLIANRYTSPQQLSIVGGSAGGIFVGRAITERPELFGAAVPAVGVMDAVRAELDPNGRANIPEFGTVDNEAGFRALYAMSSYHHVQDGVRYPAVLLVHGVNDTRVAVWQSVKFANRIASATRGGPVLMRLDYQLGHGQGSTRAQQLQQTADTWAFLLWQAGRPAFQPRP
jgi:prolyl oligopeptidase